MDYNYDDHDDFFRDDLDELRGREIEYDNLDTLFVVPDSLIDFIKNHPNEDPAELMAQYKMEQGYKWN